MPNRLAVTEKSRSVDFTDGPSMRNTLCATAGLFCKSKRSSLTCVIKPIAYKVGASKMAYSSAAEGWLARSNGVPLRLRPLRRAGARRAGSKKVAAAARVADEDKGGYQHDTVGYGGKE